MTRELAEFFESCLWVLMRDMLCSIPQCSWEILSSSDLHPTETLSASTFFEAKLASTQSKPTFCPPGYSRKFQFCSVTGSKMKNTKEMWQWWPATNLLYFLHVSTESRHRTRSFSCVIRRWATFLLRKASFISKLVGFLQTGFPQLCDYSALQTSLGFFFTLGCFWDNQTCILSSTLLRTVSWHVYIILMFSKAIFFSWSEMKR